MTKNSGNTTLPHSSDDPDEIGQDTVVQYSALHKNVPYSALLILTPMIFFSESFLVFSSPPRRWLDQ